nr:immunoglobulin light chain junction region [Macaca mulatta]
DYYCQVLDSSTKYVLF